MFFVRFFFLCFEMFWLQVSHQGFLTGSEKTCLAHCCLIKVKNTDYARRDNASSSSKYYDDVMIQAVSGFIWRHLANPREAQCSEDLAVPRHKYVFHWNCPILRARDTVMDASCGGNHREGHYI